MDLDGRVFLYLVFVQKVGNGETGWLALTIYAEAILNSGVESDDIKRTPIELLASSSRHSLNFAVTDQHQNRKVEIRDLIETTFSASFADFINLAGRA